MYYLYFMWLVSNIILLPLGVGLHLELNGYMTELNFVWFCWMIGSFSWLYLFTYIDDFLKLRLGKGWVRW